MISRTSILMSATVLLAGIFARLWVLVRRARASQKRRLHLLEIELRMDALETFRREVFRLKHYRVLRSNARRRKTELIPSTKVSSLRYIKGRQNED